MKLLCTILCVVAASEQLMGSPVKRDSPIHIDMSSPMEESGDFFEGDMILSPEQENALKDGYTAVIKDAHKWPRNLVPYAFDNTAFSLSHKSMIESALKEIEMVSCVRFVKRTTEKAYVLVTGNSGSCNSILGYTGMEQTVNLDPYGCMKEGTIIHEFLHALGFVHMISSSHRNLFVDINESAISPGKSHNFELRTTDQVQDFGIPYDYDSVMHYGPTAFSANGQPTIIPKKPGVSIGQRVGLSYKDIKRLNYLYPNCY